MNVEDVVDHESEDSGDQMENKEVLPPDHPLLDKFQKALKEHLEKIICQLSNEINDLDFNLNAVNVEREDIGANLYDLQEHIEQQKNTIDNYNNQIKELHEKREMHEKNVETLRKQFTTVNDRCKEEKQRYNQHTVELENLQILEKNILKWIKEIHDEVEASKRMVSKDGQSQLKITEEKQQMDLIVFKLDAEVRVREMELKNITEQIGEQNINLLNLNQNLSNANADLDGLQQEHKRLMTAWNEIILAIEKRDKVLSGVQDELENEYKNHKVIQANIDGTKKAATKEMEQNEKLESFRLRLTEDVDGLQRQLDKQETEFSNLTEKIDKMSVLLEHTEKDFTKSNVEGQIIENQLKSLRRKLEKQSHDKVQLEEKILLQLQDQIASDQASQARTKTLRECQEKRRTMELTMLSTEHQLSQLLFDLEKWKDIVSHNKDDVDQLMKDKEKFMKKTDKYEDEINKIKHSINLKQRSLDILNKQLVQLIEAAGGLELNPNELKIVSLEKNISELEQEIRNAQNLWLRLQSNFVNMTEKRAQQLNEIHIAKKQLMVIEQKTLKLDMEIERITILDNETKRQLKGLNLKLDQVNGRLYEKRKCHETIENECEYFHGMIKNKLQDAEMKIVQLEQEIMDAEKRIDEHRDMALDKHHEALAWETKWKMINEIKRYRQQENAQQSEIGIMKSEIHRMEIRYGQLKRAQEKLVQDMDNCVMHRDHIFDDATIREKLNATTNKSMKFYLKSSIAHRITDIKSKLNQLNGEMKLINQQLIDLKERKEKTLQCLGKLQKDLNEEHLQNSLLENEIEEAILLKQENLDDIVRTQQRAKRYRTLTISKTLPKCRSDLLITNEMDRHQDINNHLLNVLDELLNEFPDHKFNIKRVMQTLRGAG